jgi:hypothetical protein
MNSQLYKRISGIALASALVLSYNPVYTVSVATAAAATNQSSSSTIGKINFDQGTFVLQDVNMLPGTTGNTVTFKVVVQNNSNKDLMLIDYWIHVKSNAGSNFTLNLSPEDKSKAKVAAKSSLTLTYYTVVSSNLTLKDLKFEFIKWDFSQANNERSLGTLTIPSTYSETVPAGQKHIINVSDTAIQTSISRFNMGKTEKYYKPSFTLTLENVGTQSVTVPAYEFKLVTANGLVYPLTAKGADDLTLSPKDSDTITLTGSIPIDLNTKGWRLLVVQSYSDPKISLPIASYNLPTANVQTGGSLGKEYSFSTAAGDYYAVVNSIHRLPMEDNDLLSADITITNKSSETLTIPKFTGKFILDENVEVAGNIVQFDKVIGINPNSSITIQLYASIPYTYEFNDIKTVLQEKDGDGKAVDLIEFDHNTDLSPIPSIAVNGKYYVDVIGNRANLGVRKVLTYEGASANVFSVQMLAENLEKRFSNIAALHAYFETDDGLLFPANVEISENKVAPTGYALINFWKQLPKTIDTSKLKLVVGEAVLGDDGKETSNYVNPVAFILPAEDKSVPSSLADIELFPYTISISKIRTQINYEDWKVLVTFDYNLSRDLLVEDNSKDHKLILEVSDNKGIIKFSQEFSLTGDNALQVGNNKSEFSTNDANLITQIQTLQDYNFNVYHEFQSGHKKLIASKKIKWFTTTD